MGQMLGSAKPKPWLCAWVVASSTTAFRWGSGSSPKPMVRVRGKLSQAQGPVLLWGAGPTFPYGGHQGRYPRTSKGSTLQCGVGLSVSQWQVGPAQHGLLHLNKFQHMIQHMALMGPCGNTGNEHQQRLQLQQDHGPRRIQQQQQLRLCCHRGLGWQCRPPRSALTQLRVALGH